MKNNKKKIGENAKKSPTNQIKEKPQFKQNPANNKKATNKQGTGKRNQFTFAEEKRLDRIREQNERKADKQAKQLLAQKEKKRKMKILSKKNRHGQPLMKGRMELLLEKIEKRVANK